MTIAAARTPQVTAFYEPRTFSVQYVVACTETGRCAIIDPVLDYDEKSGSTATRSADAILEHVRSHGQTVEWILDTHPHADHFSAAAYLKTQTSAPTAIGETIIGVQQIWAEIYGTSPQASLDCWDRFLGAGEIFSIGNMPVRVLHSPGHTMASISYVVGDAAFIHDTLFMLDSGSARADFPGGDARQLWASIQAILALPATTRLFTGHDYQPGGREPRWESSVAQQKALNRHVCGIDEAAYVALRQARDRTLPMPKLMLHALQVNLRGGRLPAADSNGRRYLKLPLDQFSPMPW